jgi:hypothetical protein
MTADIHRIVYSSMVAIEPAARPQEISRMLSRARWSNHRNGITGALMLNGAMFVQVIEGPAAAVGRLFQGIVADPRHGNVTILENRRTGRRAFEGEPMAFVDSAELDGAMDPFLALPELGIAMALRHFTAATRSRAAAA